MMPRCWRVRVLAGLLVVLQILGSAGTSSHATSCASVGDAMTTAWGPAWGTRAVYASSQLDAAHNPQKVADGNDATYWSSAHGAHTGSIILDLGFFHPFSSPK